MNCRHCRMLVQRYHDGELGPAEKAEFESHLRTCGECRALSDRFAEVFSALGAMPLAEPPGSFDAAVMSRVDTARYRPSVASRLAAGARAGWDALPSPIRAAAAIAAVFGLFTAVYSPVIGLVADGARKVFALAGSGLFLARRIIEDPSLIDQYLHLPGKYGIALEIIADTFERQISSIPLSSLLAAGLSAAAALVLVLRAARTAGRKGETNVGIF